MAAPKKAEGRNLHQRLLAITQEIGAVKKTGRMKGGGGNYEFHKFDDIEDQLRGLFVKHGVVVYPNIKDPTMDVNTTTKSGRYGSSYDQTQFSFNCTVNLTLINADNPEDAAVISAPAQALDYSDKGPGKAVAYGCKTLYLLLFHLRGNPDNEDYAHQRGAPAKESFKRSKVVPSNGSIESQVNVIKRRYAARFPTADKDNWLAWIRFHVKDIDHDDMGQWKKEHVEVASKALDGLENGNGE